METPSSEPRYKRLTFAAITLVVLVVFAASAMMAWGQSAIDAAGTADATAPFLLPAEGEARARGRCAECGIVESIRKIPQPGEENVAVARAAGSLQRSGRNKNAGKPLTQAARYEITVRRRSGASHVFIDTDAANWRAGERVSLIDGASRSTD